MGQEVRVMSQKKLCENPDQPPPQMINGRPLTEENTLLCLIDGLNAFHYKPV